MDLVCVAPATIGLMITAYYIGFAVGGVGFNIPEKYGRKKSVIAGMFISLVSMTVMIYWPNYYARMAAFAGMGLSQIKNSVSYVWASECVPLP